MYTCLFVKGLQCIMFKISTKCVPICSVGNGSSLRETLCRAGSGHYIKTCCMWYWIKLDYSMLVFIVYWNRLMVICLNVYKRWYHNIYKCPNNFMTLVIKVLTGWLWKTVILSLVNKIMMDCSTLGNKLIYTQHCGNCPVIETLHVDWWLFQSKICS